MLLIECSKVFLSYKWILCHSENEQKYYYFSPSLFNVEKISIWKKKWKRRRSSFWARFVLVMMLFLLLAFRRMCWRLFIYSLAAYFVYLFIWLCLKRHMRCVCVMWIDTASTSNYFWERERCQQTVITPYANLHISHIINITFTELTLFSILSSFFRRWNLSIL